MYDLDKITVIDNFLDNDIAENLENTILWGTFRWSCGRSVTADNYSTTVIIDPLYDIQLVNLIYAKHFKNPKNEREVENDYKLILPFMKKLNIKTKQLIRIKVNATLCKETVMKSGWHTDVLQSENGHGMTAIYYINTNNGKTLFKTGEEIESIKNRIVIFPNNFPHTPQYHTNTPMRGVINFNWLTNP